MSKKLKLLPCIAGIVVGIATVIGGFASMDTSTYFINDSFKFGADFYTEIYKATIGVGHAVNYAINDLISVFSGILLSIGAMEICFFSYKLINAWPEAEKVESLPSETVSVVAEAEAVIDEQVAVEEQAEEQVEQ